MSKPYLHSLADRRPRDPRWERSRRHIEARLDEVDKAAARFFRAPSAEGLRAWRSLAGDLLEPVDDPWSRARLTAHEALLRAVSSHEIDDPDARVAWAARLGQDAVGASQLEDLVRGLGIMLLSTLTPGCSASSKWLSAAKSG
jgi:hypothetical protein